jgi:hypothetical protein
MGHVLTWLIQREACRSRFIAGVHREFRLRNRAAFDRGEAIASAGSDREHRRPIAEKSSTRAKQHYRQQEVPCISRHFRTLSFRDTSHPERDCIRATAARAAVRIPPPKACCKQMCCCYTRRTATTSYDNCAARRATSRACVVVETLPTLLRVSALRSSRHVLTFPARVSGVVLNWYLITLAVRKNTPGVRPAGVRDLYVAVMPDCLAPHYS